MHATIRCEGLMAISKGIVFLESDVFIDYPFEEVMFRWDHVAEKVYRRFYGKDESLEPISQSNRLYNDAILYGDQITQEEYRQGKQRR